MQFQEKKYSPNKRVCLLSSEKGNYNMHHVFSCESFYILKKFKPKLNKNCSNYVFASVDCLILFYYLYTTALLKYKSIFQQRDQGQNCALRIKNTEMLFKAMGLNVRGKRNGKRDPKLSINTFQHLEVWKMRIISQEE